MDFVRCPGEKSPNSRTGHRNGTYRQDKPSRANDAWQPICRDRNTYPGCTQRQADLDGCLSSATGFAALDEDSGHFIGILRSDNGLTKTKPAQSIGHAGIRLTAIPAYGLRKAGSPTLTRYVIGPDVQGQNSSSPMPCASLLVSSPLATATIFSKISWPNSSTETPLRIRPASMSMSSIIF